MVRLLFGSYETKHFHPKLMEHIYDRENREAIDLIRAAAAEYNLSRLTDATGSTLLHHAAREGNEEVTSCLLELGFNANALDQYGKTPLALAVSENRVSTVEILLAANSDIHVKVGNRRSLVQSVFDGTIACLSHIVEMLVRKVMAEHDAEVNSQATALIELKCPLYHVVGLKNPVITKKMLSHDCAVNTREPRHGNSPLHRAVYFKDVENVKLLLANGADVNGKDNGGKIAWRCAPNLDGTIVQLKVLGMLLDRRPALKSLTVGGRMQMYELFVRGSEAAVVMILRSGIDFSGKDGKGDTVFHYLAMNRNLSGSKLLPDKNCFMENSRNQGRLTALHVAARNGIVGAMKFLLSNGANVDSKTGDRGLTALLLAVRAKSEGCVKLLLERGADAQFASQTNKTAFDMVRDSDDSAVKTLLAHLALLESRGATIVPMIRAKIDGCEKYRSRFEDLKKQLEEMKRDKIGESLTLFDFLVGENTGERVRSKEVQSKLKSRDSKTYNFDSYYSSILKKRVRRAVKVTELFE